MIIYIENPDESMKQPQELNGKFRKASEYQVSTQKSITFL